MLAQNIGDLVHPEDQGLVGEVLQDAIQHKRGWSGLVIRWRHKNGSYRHLHSNGVPILDMKGELTGFRGADRDITDRIRSEAALRESAQRLHLVFDTALDAIISTDEDTLITDWNQQAEALFGWTRDEVLGRPLALVIIPPRFRDDYSQDQRSIKRTGTAKSIGQYVERYVQDRDGREIPVELAVSPAQIGNSTTVTAFIRDIRARKAVEAELHLAKEMAEVDTRAKSEFLANMSHEIRTPMNGIIGMTELLLDTKLTEEQRRYAQTVHASGETLLALINDILDLSKIEAGKLALEMLDFDLRDLLDDFTGMMAVQAHDKGLVLGCVASPEVPYRLRGDPGRLRQILMNLTGNAIKFTAQGEVIIRVNVVSETESDALLRFDVCDTGIGIPPDKLGRLFTKFSQVDSSTSRTYGGTGLGLAISKQLTEAMGGEIGVQSDPGQGSEFWFTANMAKASSSESAAAPVDVDLHGVRILIVDDTDVNREILMVLLKTWGLRPCEVADGEAALRELTQAKATQDPIAVAILDMDMPVIDGAALARAIKADPNLRDTRLVMCTSLGQAGGGAHGEGFDFISALTKPVRRHELREALKAAVGSGNTAASQMNARPQVVLGKELRHARILVAEDNLTNQMVAVGILKKLGLKADVAANGNEAVKALETIPYDLVLMDVQMPEMDGIEATRQVRDPLSRVLDHQVPVVAMTAHAMGGDREKCLEAGMDDYLTKPVRISRLVSVLEKWLRPRGENGQPPEQAEETKASVECLSR